LKAFIGGGGRFSAPLPKISDRRSRCLKKTIRLEPESSVGYALAALAYLQQASQGMNNNAPRLLDRAAELAQEALRLKDVSGLADLVLAHVYLRRKEHEKDLSAAESSVLARPSCDAAFTAKAEVLNYLGRPAEAIGLAQYAMRLAPVYPAYYPAVLAAAYYGCGRFAEALDAAQISLEADPSNLEALLLTVAANAALERLEQAQEVARQVLGLKPGFTIESFAVTHPYKDRCHLEEMTSRLQQAGL
jgi:tetratricopeptide (TPR) repeat protein